MTSPNTTLETLRPDLGGSMEEFDLEMNMAGMVGLQVFRPFEAPVQAGVFGKVPIELLLKSRETRRGPGGGYARQRWQFTADSYATQEHGAEEPIDDREAKMYRNYLDIEVISATRARHAVMENYERRVAAKVFDTGTYSPTNATVAWATVATAKPVDDVEAAWQRLWAKGIIGNALVINRLVFRNLVRTAQIQDIVASQGAGGSIDARSINVQMLKQVFNLDYIIVAGMQRNTADEGLAASLSPIWSSGLAAVCRVAESDDIREPCLGRTFHWGEDGSSIGGVFESYRDPSVRSDIIRNRMDTDEKRLYEEACELIDITPGG